jgi:hypothetical protein
MIRRPVIAVALLAVVVAAGACGRKTDPLTPDSPRPEAVKDIRITVRDRVAYLSWPVPARNIEGKAIGPADIAAFRIERAEVERGRKRLRYREVAIIRMAEPAPATVRDGTVAWSDTLQYNRVYSYRIRAVSTRGGAGIFSDEVRAAPLLALAAPKPFSAAAGDGVVTLTWEAVTLRTDGSVHQGFIGYNVYRGTEAGRPGETPLNAEPVRTTTYRDLAVENGKRYFYHVRAVDSPVPPWRESQDSDEAQAQPQDLTPPAAPSGLTVVPGIGRVFLTWNESKERDLAGYHVYRAAKSGESERLTDKPLNRTTFSDEKVKQGTTYFYTITAVDRSGNESPRAKEVRTATERIR